MKFNLLIVFLLFLVAPKSIFAQCSSSINGSVYSVTTDVDGGPGSLRQAIIDANNDNVGGVIGLNGPYTSFPIYSQLPDVTCDSLIIFDQLPVIIDGQNLVSEPGIRFLSNVSCMGPFTMSINFLPAIFTVINNNDSGAGSLRDMIQQSNFSASPDAINFNIPGQAPHIIQLATELPAINYSLTIDGSTQPANGYGGNAPKIIVDGGNDSFLGLFFNYINPPYLYNGALYGLYLTNFSTAVTTNRAANFTMGVPGKGNVISGNVNGGFFERDTALLIQNNFIGTDTSGTSSEGNVIGISSVGGNTYTHTVINNLISGNSNAGMLLYSEQNFTFAGNKVGTDITGAYAIPNNNYGLVAVGNKLIIGGTAPGEGNLFSGNCISSIVANKAALLVSADSSVVIGNKFGTNLTGTDTIPNRFGSSILFYGKNLRIGGPLAAERNIISGSAIGIQGIINSQGTIQNNYIGTDITGNINLGNAINISLGIDSVSVIGNKIASATKGIEIGNGVSGIIVTGNEIYNNIAEGIFNWGTSNKFTQNSIYDNGEGIRNYLFANDSIAPPVITYIDTVSVAGTSLPNATIELFYSQSSNFLPQGKIYIATTIADNLGVWNYSGLIINPLNVTATQTDALSNTSAFSLLWTQSTPNVWPGDCNYDLVVDNFDFVFLGMAFGNSGPVRTGATINWNGQPATDWTNTYFNGINFKHADCNGDGMVSLTDAIAINQNYNLTHPFRISQQQTASTIYDFYLVAVNDTIAPGDYATFEIHAGNNTIPVDQLYGAAWSLFFDLPLADTSNILYDYSSSTMGTWHSDFESFEKTFYSSGMVAQAITKTNQNDALMLNGILGTIAIKSKSSINTVEVMHSLLSDIRALRMNGNDVQFTLSGDSVVIDPAFTGMHEIENNSIIQLYPNPASGIIYIKSKYKIIDVKICDASGKLLLANSPEATESHINISSLANGIYNAKITSTNGVVYRKIFVHH